MLFLSPTTENQMLQGGKTKAASETKTKKQDILKAKTELKTIDQN